MENFHFEILYFYPEEEKEEWIEGEILAKDIPSAINEIIDKWQLESKNISSIRVED